MQADDDSCPLSLVHDKTKIIVRPGFHTSDARWGQGTMLIDQLSTLRLMTMFFKGDLRLHFCTSFHEATAIIERSRKITNRPPPTDANLNLMYDRTTPP